MSCKFPSLLKCFLFTLKQATTNLACAPFFCFAVFFYSFYYCWPYMEQLPDHLNVVAVDQDNSALSRRLTQAMRASPNLQVTQQTTSLPEAQNLMRKGGISAILIIPPNFETHTLTNVPTALVLVTNGAFIVKSRGSMSGVGGPLQKIVAASISAHLVEHGVPLSEIARAANNPPSMIVESMFNTVNGYLNFTVPIVFMIIFQTIFVCGIGMLMNDWFWKRKYPFPLALWIGLTFFTSSSIAEIIRAGVLAVPKGQWHAAEALGMTRLEAISYVIFPQALKLAVPPLASQYMNLTKNSSLAVVVGYPDLVSIGNSTINLNGQALEVIVIIMSVYLFLNLVISVVMNSINRIVIRGSR